MMPLFDMNSALRDLDRLGSKSSVPCELDRPESKVTDLCDMHRVRSKYSVLRELDQLGSKHSPIATRASFLCIFTQTDVFRAERSVHFDSDRRISTRKLFPAHFHPNR